MVLVMDMYRVAGRHRRGVLCRFCDGMVERTNGNLVISDGTHSNARERRINSVGGT